MEAEVVEWKKRAKENEPDDLKYTENLFRYILSTKYILYDANNQKFVLSEATDMLRDPYYSSIHPLLTEVKIKIEQINQDIQEHMPNHMKNLGVGGFGCVVEPALPNRIDSGWTNYPKNVSKLYFRSEDAKQAVKKSESLYKFLKNDGHKMMNQSLTYKGSNISPNLRKKCGFARNSIITATRMPYLGVSIKDLPPVYKQFHRFPVQTIFSQFLKLIQQVDSLNEQGYVHGDIRETNIMANPSTGILTLIDFDWLLQKDIFFPKYSEHLGFYNNPPESLLYENVKYYLRRGELVPNENPQAIHLYVTHNNMFTFRQYTGKILSSMNVHQANIQNIQQFSKIRTIEEYYDELFPSFDSYGLGCTLLEFCRYVYPYNVSMKDMFGSQYSEEEVKIVESYIRRLYDTILLPMIDLHMLSRLTIESAYTRMKQLQDDFLTEFRNLVSNNLERFARREEIMETYKPKGSARKTRRARKPYVRYL